MSFVILPYLLGTYLEQVQNQLTLHNTLEGVDHYAVKPEYKSSILELPTSSISLYFFENKLVSVYYRLRRTTKDYNEVVAYVKRLFHQEPFYRDLDEGVINGWKDEDEFLALLNSKLIGEIMIYHSLNEYNVFDEKSNIKVQE